MDDRERIVILEATIERLLYRLDRVELQLKRQAEDEELADYLTRDAG